MALLLILPGSHQTSELPPCLWREKGAWHKAKALSTAHESSALPDRTISLLHVFPFTQGSLHYQFL